MSSLPPEMQGALHGRRILVTRAQKQSGRLQAMLEAVGAQVVGVPAIEIVPLESYVALDAALAAIGSFDWLVLTSSNAVHALLERLRQQGMAVERLKGLKVAAIGNATAETVRSAGLAVDLMPPSAVAESLAEALIPAAREKHVLLVRAQVARDMLPERLSAAGVKVTVADAYRTVIPEDSAALLRAAFADGTRPVDAATFTSASSVHHLAALADVAGVSLPRTMRKVSIGPITSSAILEHGWQVDAEAAGADMASLVAAVVEALREKS